MEQWSWGSSLSIVTGL